MASQQSLRRALGAIKDSTSVSLAKVNSEFKELDVAIVKSTSHLEDPPKEKHVRTIFAATSAIRPRADVAYCIVALARRLAKTHNWAVALKTLLVIHRTLREGDPTFREELINYGHSRGQILNMSQFKDDSSPEAWELSAWVRSYALFLEERLECFRVLKYDVDTEKTARTKNLDTMELLEQLPALQQLQYHLMGCQPEGSARFNRLVPCALNLVLKESIKLYQAISDGTINLVDKFFEMQRHDAVRAFDIYKKAGQQTERLSEFYEHCKSFDMSRNLKFPPLEQPPQSFISAMEEYVKEAPRQSTVRDISGSRDSGKVQLALEYKVSSESEATADAVIAPPAAPESSFPAKPTPIPSNNNVDLLGLNEPIPDPSVLDESNALALAIVTTGPTTNGSAQDRSRSLDLAAATTTGWELALVETQSSNNNALVESKLAGGFDRMTLDSLYDDGLTRPTYAGQATYGVSLTPNPHESPAVLQAAHHDPFFASSKIAPPPSVQMAALQQQQQFMMMQQQQQQMMGMQPSMNISNPFGQATYGMPYAYTPGLQPQPQPQLQLQLHGPPQNNNPFGSTGLL